MPAKQLTEANCHPRYSCSKLLLIDVAFIWFSDRMLFSLTTPKIWSKASGAGKNRMLEQKRFFHARMTPSQSLIATDGALKLNYASVIFVDAGVQIDENELYSLTTVAVCHTQGLW